MTLDPARGPGESAGMEKSDIGAPAGPSPITPIRKRDGLAETTRFLLVLVIAAVLLRSLFVAAFNIPSGSMLPRMMIGDYLFVAKWPYGYSRYSFPFGLGGFDGRIMGASAERGDVVVFRYPGSDQDYVKRLIGLPGDMIQVRGGTLYLNGEAVQKTPIADYLVPISPNSPCRFVDPGKKREVMGADGRPNCAYPRYRETLPGGKTYEVIDQANVPRADDTEIFMVPEGHYFVMGDNRDDSLDSRFPVAMGGVGMLPADNLVGRGLITFFSTDGSAELLKPWTWVSAARWHRIGETY